MQERINGRKWKARPFTSNVSGWKAFSHTWTAGTTLSGLRHRRITNLQKDKNSDNWAKQRLFPCKLPLQLRTLLEHRSIIHTYPTLTQHPTDRASSPHEVWQSHRNLSTRDYENLINKKKGDNGIVYLSQSVHRQLRNTVSGRGKGVLQPFVLSRCLDNLVS